MSSRINGSSQSKFGDVAAICSLVLVSTFFAGCAEKDKGHVLVSSSISQSLAYINVDDILEPGEHEVCFQPFDQETRDDDGWSALKSEIRSLVESRYETLSAVDLDFTGWRECPNWADFEKGNQPSNVIQFVVDIDGNGAAVRRCSGATPVADDCSGGDKIIVQVNGEYWIKSEDRRMFETAVVHEMGHALGFSPHEFNRSDSPEGPGPWPQDLDKCSESTGLVMLDSGGDPACDGDDPGHSNDLFVTRWDRSSIMSGTYCHCRPELSSLDRLGFEIAFPISFSHTVKARHAFVLGDGSSLARHNVEFWNPWVARGAASDAFSSDNTWRVGAFTVALGDVYDPAFPPGTKTALAVSAAWSDFKERAHTASTVVTVDDSAHAALVLAVL